MIHSGYMAMKSPSGEVKHLTPIIYDAPEKGDFRVRFYDYDGTYKDVWVNEGEDAVPPNFDHSVATDFAPALTFQEWNKPYTNITEDTEIRPVYIPTDGKTHFYLQITSGTDKDITVFLGNSGRGNIVINWGDGTPDFSSAVEKINASHTFADYGIYHCTIENTSTGDFWLGRGDETTVFCGGYNQKMRDALIAIYLGEKVQINTESFGHNYALKYVTIPIGVTSIARDAFLACSSLTNIVFPSSLTSIGNHAFSNCHSLTNVTIPNSVTSIGDFAFNYCHSLTDIAIPGSVTTIREYAFTNCPSVTNITISNGVFSIENYAFRDCNCLTNLTIPSSLTSIGSFAFSNCYSLKKVLIEGDTRKTLTNSNAFNGIRASSLFFVKDELVATYKGATNWVTYANKIMPMSEEGNYFG